MEQSSKFRFRVKKIGFTQVNNGSIFIDGYEGDLLIVAIENVSAIDRFFREMEMTSDSSSDQAIATAEIEITPNGIFRN